MTYVTMYCRYTYIYNAQLLVCIVVGVHIFYIFQHMTYKLYKYSHHVAMNLRTCFFPSSTHIRVSVSSIHISRGTTCSHHHCKETAGNWTLPLPCGMVLQSYRNQLTSWRSHQETHKFCCKGNSKMILLTSGVPRGTS